MLLQKITKKLLVGSKWEFDYPGIRQDEFDPVFSVSNLTLNEDKTFNWNVISDDDESDTFSGTYLINFYNLELTYQSGSTEIHRIRIDAGKLFLDDDHYTKVSSDFKRTAIYAESATTTSISSENVTNNSNSSNSAINYNCALIGCPNKTTSPGTYCSVHAKGKINTCVNCGAKIWADEIYCDNVCLVILILLNMR